MRKTVLIGLGAVGALVAAAVGAAAVFTAGGVTATTATLNTTQAGDVKTRTCTGADEKTFTVTDGRYTGVADFTNPGSEFDGPITVRARTIVDTASKLGVVTGTFRIKDDDSSVSGRFTGTLDANGNLNGFLTGASRGNHAAVYGTLGGTFSTATGLTGKLGTAPLTPAAVVVGPICKGKPKQEQKPRSVRIEGTISAIGGTPASITLSPKGPVTATCQTDASSPSLSGFEVGTRVQMTCVGIVNGSTTTWTLRELKKKAQRESQKRDHK